MLSIRPEEDRKLREILTALCTESKAKVVFLIDKAGQLISRSNAPAYTSNDITFASLTAGNVAASEALSKLLGDKTLNHAFTETEDEGIYMSLIKQKLILVVIFEKYTSNLGIIRVKLKKYKPQIEEIIENIEMKSSKEKELGKEIDIEDINIDNLFE
ncbi:roadblock/LC7 domain-containing protein [Desulfurobacterium atlanticum]|uniref:Predicted regulator of Ras-like GTPase activity, Roadblock/LC7/MglB family n=1 Tax=Desulfurobacterium atlanticum TaxID=240169 RepID=A0A238XKT0_9BACT|nr:roadblock/LC7 domain-containing protein [Desulfurobacterium atlanticum]SNR58934.1 Predicted regulator of Ras-like GTPase activity, Roadblock/LC7/MglB family [Desulfurobacterium atlanticum]